MSVALPLNDDEYRVARQALVSFFSSQSQLSDRGRKVFRAFDDGDMGGFIVQWEEQQTEASEQIASEYHFVDIDNIDVLITAYTRDKQKISSVEFWKVDFSPIKTFPEPTDLTDLESSGLLDNKPKR